MKLDCPVQFHGIDHVVLQVTDSERALHFYTQILGLTVERVINTPHALRTTLYRSSRYSVPFCCSRAISVSE